MLIRTHECIFGYCRLSTETPIRGTTGTTGRRLSRSRSRAGPRSHPEVRRGASRRRGIEWERPHTLSWRPAIADDAEGMSGKSSNRLAPVLTEASSWTSDRRAQGLVTAPARKLGDRGNEHSILGSV